MCQRFYNHILPSCSQGNKFLSYWNLKLTEKNADDITAGTFRFFVQWIYSQNLTLRHLKDREPDDNDKTKDDENDTGDIKGSEGAWNPVKREAADREADCEEIIDKNPPSQADVEESMDLARTWVLADKMMIPALQNAVLDKLDQVADAMNTYPSVILRYVYENTYHGSQFRKYLVSRCLSSCCAYQFRRDQHSYPPALLMDLLVAKTKTTSIAHFAHLEVPWEPVSKFYVAETG